MSLEELHEAISIQQSQKSWNSPKIRLSATDVSVRCRNMVIHDSIENVIKIPHTSVRAFLLSATCKDKLQLDLSHPECLADLTEKCLTYLNFTDFQRALARTPDERSMRALENPLALNVQALSINKSPLVGTLTRARSWIHKPNIATALYREFNRGQRHDESKYHFLDYCRAYWYLFTKNWDMKTAQQYAQNLLVLSTMLRNRSLPFEWLPWEPFDENLEPYERWDMFLWSVKHGHILLYQIWEGMVPQDEVANTVLYLWESNSLKEEGDMLLQEAASIGSINRLQLYLGGLKSLCSTKTWSRQADEALILASKHGHSATVQYLLDDVSPDHWNLYAFWSSMNRAAHGGHVRVVDILLQSFHARRQAALGPLLTGQFGDQTPLHLAAKIGHLEVMKRLLDADLNANAKDAHGMTALHYAADGDFISIVELLLSQGEILLGEDDGALSLLMAARHGHLALVEKLLLCGVDPNEVVLRPYEPWEAGHSSLELAAGAGHLAVVQVLVKAGSDVNRGGDDVGLLDSTVESSRLRITNEAIGKWNEPAEVENAFQSDAENRSPGAKFIFTALRAAAFGGHLEVVKRLLNAGATPHEPESAFVGRTALGAAAQGGHLAIMEALLEAGADAALINKGSRRSPLQAAAQSGNFDAVKILLDAMMHLDTESHRKLRQFALTAAALGGSLDIINCLLKSDIDVDSTLCSMIHGRTVLEAAAGRGHVAIVKRLIDAEAEVDGYAPYGQGKTPLQAATEGGHREVIEILVASGASIRYGFLDGMSNVNAASERGHLASATLLKRSRS